ncbi:MAG: Maf family protein [Alphaproteobacteria bacterium]
MGNRSRLLLASASPRRRELLAQTGIVPDQISAAKIDEKPHKGELPRAYALRIAREKCEAASRGHPAFVVLAADTVVACGRRILPHAEGAEEVRACLAMLSGRRHVVYTGLAVCGTDGKMRTKLVATRVAFKRLISEEIESYAASGEGEGKAGGYAIQGRAGAFVRLLNGSYTNVVGLPLYETVSLLNAAGYA